MLINVRPTNGGRLAAKAASCPRGRTFPEFSSENTERATGSESETTERFSLSSLQQITAAVYTPRTAGCFNLSWQTTKIKASSRVSSHVNTFWPGGRVNCPYSFYFQEPFWKKMMHTINKTSNSSWEYYVFPPLHLKTELIINQKYFYSVVPTYSVQISRWH